MTLLGVALAGLIRSIVHFYTFVSLPFYLIIQKPWRNRESKAPAPYIHFNRTEKYVSCRNERGLGQLHKEVISDAEVDTMEKLMQFAAHRYADRKVLGTREVLAVETQVQSDGRALTKYSLGDYHWKTYRQVSEEMTLFGRGLAALGLTAKQNVVLFSETRAEWITAAFGCMKQSLPLVTLYANLNDEALVHGVTETGVGCIITSQSLLPRVINLMDQLTNVKTLIFFQDRIQGEDSLAATPTAPDGLQLIAYEQIVEMGNSPQLGDRLPSPEDTAIIMYTSGSTGRPKGVILSHRNITCSLFGYLDVFQFAPDDVILAYLPLAHVLELIAEVMVFVCGASIGYSSPLTLTDRSSKVKEGQQGDATFLRPTAIFTVPLIYERMYKSIQENMENGPELIRSVVKFLIDYKIFWTGYGFSTPILDRLIMRPKLASILGGRVRQFIGGGAPLAPDTHEFIRAVFCCPIFHGYGLTETTSSGIVETTDKSTGTVGVPTPCCHIKLVDWHSGGYLLSDEPYPRGEIHIAGDVVAGGYYNQPELTAEEFYEEDGQRWFRTGDIGEMTPACVFKIIDRKKDLIKNQYGEYIALSHVESVLKTCPLIDNICVFADSMQCYTVALVSPNEQQLKLAAQKAAIVEEDWDKLCSNVVMEEAVRQQIAQHPSVRNGYLRKFEVPQKLKIVPELWTPESDLVTSSFKLKRKNLRDKYRVLIESFY